MYEIKESGPCPPRNNCLFLVEWLRGKRKVMEIICQVWLKITCGQSLWRQKMIEVNNCYFIDSCYFHVRWMQEEKPLLLSGGKGSEQGGCFRTNFEHQQLSVFEGRCWVPVPCSCPSSTAQRLLWSSASSGLQEELWIVAVMLYFKSAAGSLAFTFWSVTQSVLRFPTRDS